MEKPAKKSSRISDPGSQPDQELSMINAENGRVLIAFGAHIKKLREKKKLTHRQLAELCKLHSSKISRIEAGKINITFLTIIELATALETPPGALLQFLTDAEKENQTEVEHSQPGDNPAPPVQ